MACSGPHPSGGRWHVGKLACHLPTSFPPGSDLFPTLMSPRVLIRSEESLGAVCVYTLPRKDGPGVDRLGQLRCPGPGPPVLGPGQRGAREGLAVMAAQRCLVAGACLQPGSRDVQGLACALCCPCAGSREEGPGRQTVTKRGQA